MAKKIVILNGSPRPRGNTAALIEAFTKGAEQAGNGVVRFDVCKMNIHPCLGCCGGGKNPESPCVQKDDMDAIYPHYKDADLVVLASPMYYWSLSGQLKCAFDRLFAVMELSPSYENPVKDCVLLMGRRGRHGKQLRAGAPLLSRVAGAPRLEGLRHRLCWRQHARRGHRRKAATGGGRSFGSVHPLARRQDAALELQQIPKRESAQWRIPFLYPALPDTGMRKGNLLS